MDVHTSSPPAALDSAKRSALGLTCVVGKLDRVYRVYVEPQQLQGEHRALVAHVPAYDMTLNAGRCDTDSKGGASSTRERRSSA